MRFKFFVLFFIVSFGAGCVSLGEYALIYPNTQTPGPGITPPQNLVSVPVDVTGESGQREQTGLQCEFFRNQLFLAAEKAKQHRTNVWLLPWYWPAHWVTLYLFPIEETQKANLVLQAAHDLERAYQSSREQFIETCQYWLQHEPLGAAFRAENPYFEDRMLETESAPLVE